MNIFRILKSCFLRTDRTAQDHADAVAELSRLIQDTRDEADAYETDGRKIMADKFRRFADQQELKMKITLLSY